MQLFSSIWSQNLRPCSTTKLHSQLVIYLFIYFLRERVLLSAQASLILVIFLPVPPQQLGLQMCTTMPDPFSSIFEDQRFEQTYLGQNSLPLNKQTWTHFYYRIHRKTHRKMQHSIEENQLHQKQLDLFETDFFYKTRNNLEK